MTNPHDIATIKAIYMQNRSLFTWPRDDREATAVLNDFFSDANFIKRLKLHQAHINKSKTKMKSILTLYFMEINEHNKVMNMLAQKDGHSVLTKH